jgi:hypothetical protein
MQTVLHDFGFFWETININISQVFASFRIFFACFLLFLLQILNFFNISDSTCINIYTLLYFTLL